MKQERIHFYESNIKEYDLKIKSLETSINRLSTLRLIFVLISGVRTYYFDVLIDKGEAYWFRYQLAQTNRQRVFS